MPQTMMRSSSPSGHVSANEVQAKEVLHLNCNSELAAMAQHLVRQWHCGVQSSSRMVPQTCALQSALASNTASRGKSQGYPGSPVHIAWRDHEALSTPAPPQLLTSKNLDLFSGRMRQEQRHWHRLEMYSSSSSSMGSSRAALQAVGSVLCCSAAALKGLVVWHATHSRGVSNVMYAFWVPTPHKSQKVLASVRRRTQCSISLCVQVAGHNGHAS